MGGEEWGCEEYGVRNGAFAVDCSVLRVDRHPRQVFLFLFPCNCSCKCCTKLNPVQRDGETPKVLTWGEGSAEGQAGLTAGFLPIASFQLTHGYQLVLSLRDTLCLAVSSQLQ